MAVQRAKICAAHMELDFFPGMGLVKYERYAMKRSTQPSVRCACVVDGDIVERIKNRKLRNFLLNDRALGDQDRYQNQDSLHVPTGTTWRVDERSRRAPATCMTP